jgi:transcriptional regulator with XRE-family HTH domain
MNKTIVEKYVEDPQQMRAYQQERAIVEVTDLLEVTLEQKGITRSEFAKLLGRTKGWVTQLLDGEGNKTIRTLADAFAVLGLEYKSDCKDIGISNEFGPSSHVSLTIYQNESTYKFSTSQNSNTREEFSTSILKSAVE